MQVVQVMSYRLCRLMRMKSAKLVQRGKALVVANQNPTNIHSFWGGSKGFPFGTPSFASTIASRSVMTKAI